MNFELNLSLSKDISINLEKKPLYLQGTWQTENNVFLLGPLEPIKQIANGKIIENLKIMDRLQFQYKLEPEALVSRFLTISINISGLI